LRPMIGAGEFEDAMVRYTRPITRRRRVSRYCPKESMVYETIGTIHRGVRGSMEKRRVQETVSKADAGLSRNEVVICVDGITKRDGQSYPMGQFEFV